MGKNVVMVLITIATFSCAQQPPPLFKAAVGGQRHSYQQLAHLALQQAGDSITQLEGSVVFLLQSPTRESLLRARDQWAVARQQWNIAEAFSLAPSKTIQPNVAVDKLQFWAATRIDAWPLDPTLIQRIVGNGEQVRAYSLSVENIEAMSGSKGEGSYTLGFHAIEYLLWGDPETQPTQNDILASLAVNDDNSERRRKYLMLITRQLLADHQYLHSIWNGGRGSYAHRMKTVSDTEATRRVFEGLIQLIDQEMIYRSMEVPVHTANRRLAQSYFSQQTGRDLLSNFEGIEAVMFGRLNSYSGVGLLSLVEAVDANLGQRLNRELKLARRVIVGLRDSFDGTISSSAGDNGRAVIGALVTALSAVRQSLEEAAATMRIDLTDNS